MAGCEVRSFIVFLCMVVTLVSTGSAKYARQVLLVSMDGFRWDYVNQTSTPNFDRMARQGTHALYINSTFITKTFPDHYTIVTGLYEESHGILGNRMYDPVFNATFSRENQESRWWDGGEPLWVTARNNGRKSATFYWPGSEAEIRGVRPNIWLPYNESAPFRPRVDRVMDWLVNDSIDFVTLYFHEPDKTGHKYGPDSTQILGKVREMDGILGYILDNLEKFSLKDKVNLIVLSDHGMTSIDLQRRLIDITEVIDMEEDVLFTLDSGPIMHINPRKDPRYVVQKIRNATVPHLTVYLKEEIPIKWHYGNNRRVMPIFATADEGWAIVTNATIAKTWTEKGDHGYDNALLSMKPIFYAMGPNIRQNYQASVFKNVDIYPLVCELLQIPPAPNNGSLLRVQSFIVANEGPNGSAELKPFSLWVLLFCSWGVITNII
ncbi:ectonucleotide pyrophosphatase/phosphodiesterase family member 5-like isoform X2 [Ostrea edulis]|uniref:ectonucleotide pyrophosphatase/phosphodiesterase family member 5-like isoform X2 n=1 Tax=Ostrea edulis TaxID=37623 RepID=UPI0024AF3B09|nr:ectonucleotide pyrophosphatase/phosphodiesterase family member 5-like isoform X2 [Ostrea edulis]